MKIICNAIVVFLSVTMANLFSMDSNRPEGVLSREHEIELIRAERVRQLRQEREQAHQQRMVERRAEIEKERRQNQGQGVARRLFAENKEG